MKILRITGLFLFFLVVLPVSGAFSQDEAPKTDATYTSSDEARQQKTAAMAEEQKAVEAQVQEEAKDVQAAQDEIEAVKAEKESLEKEILLKEEEAALAEQELEALQKAAAATNGKSDQKKLEKSQKELEGLRKEMEAQKERLAIAARKEELAAKKLTKEQEEIERLQQQLYDMKIQRAGLDSPLGKAIRSIIVILLAIISYTALRLGTSALQKTAWHNDGVRESELELRIKTLANLFNWIGGIVILLVALYLLLSLFGFNVAPLVAGAGVIGIAFGFGGQYLIRDLINGMFVLIEGQYRINDVVKIGEHGGLVEDVNLRITTLRDLEGRVIIIPNGEIKTVINFTRGYAQALLDIGVAYKENVDRVMDVIRQVGAEMRKDTYFGRLILDDLEMLGVDNFADSAVIIKFRMKTRPIKQWEVSREFRRRLKNRFDELGIEIPFPHRTLYWGTGEDNKWVRDTAEKLVPK